MMDPAQTRDGDTRCPRALAYEIGPALLYAAGMVAASPRLHIFQNDSDEGLNLIKASLLSSGGTLYRQIWSDQPPVFTFLLRWLWSVTGASLLASRLLVLFFAVLLLWACARFAGIAWGTRAALLAPLAVVLTPSFHRLSVSVMIGLPAVALGALSLAAAAQWTRSRRPWVAALSGVLLGVSIMTKLFTAVLIVPVLVVILADGTPRRETLRAAWVWAVTLLATLAAILTLAVGADGAIQITQPHLAAAHLRQYRGAAIFDLETGRRRFALLLLAAAVTTWATLRKRAAPATAAVLWAALAGVALLLHRPVRYHQVLLLAVPVALLAAAAADRAIGTLLRGVARMAGERARAAAAALAALAALLLVAFDAQWLENHARWQRKRTREEALLSALRDLARPGDVILTDLPMYAFRAGLDVPRDTAVLSEKRFLTGWANEAMLHDTIERERPRFVLLGRFPVPSLRGTLRTRWRRAWSRNGQELFVAPEPAVCAWPRCLDLPDAWYAGPEALQIAQRIAGAQHSDGGWAKNQERTLAVRYGVEPCDRANLEGCSSIDNDATTAELRFLARAIAAAPRPELTASFERGLKFLLSAQYPTGGWPQVPAAPRDRYQSAITLNDDANSHVLELLRDVSSKPGHDFLSKATRDEAARAFDRGVAMLLRAQVVRDGRRTGWCAQHDPVTLAPVHGRRYEPASLSGRETVGVVRLLMSVPHPDPAVVSAIESAAVWLRESRIEGREPALWARFYSLESGRPLFPERDGRVRDTFAALSIASRSTYDYLTDAPRALLEVDLPRWRAELRDQPAPAR